VKHEVEPVQLVVVRIRSATRENGSVARRQEFGLSGRHGDHRRTVLLGQQFDQPVHKRPPLERQRLRFVKNYHAPYSEGSFIERAFVGPARLSNTWTNVVTTIPDRQLAEEGGDVLDGVVGD